jgi:hypothetical protein
MFDLPSKKTFNAAYKAEMGGLQVPYHIPDELMDDPAFADALDAAGLYGYRDIKPAHLYNVLEVLHEMSLDGDEEADVVAWDILESVGFSHIDENVEVYQ